MSTDINMISQVATDIMNRDNVGPDVFEKLSPLFANARVEVNQQGNFTLANLFVTVPIKGGDKLFVFPGATKRHKHDFDRPECGRMTAISRAVRFAVTRLTDIATR